MNVALFESAAWRNRKLGVAALALLAVLIFVSLVFAGYYPVALVNGRPVTATRFSRNYGAARVYYGNAARTYNPAGAGIETPSPAVLETEVLNRLVEASLVEQEARRAMGSDLARLVESRIGRYDDDASLRRAAETLYGLAYREFREEVLVPQAERDVLAGRFFLKGETVERWLLEAKRSARVLILSKRFRWDGEKVVSVGP